MANTGSNASNKIWNVTNVSNYSISIGDIVGLQTINPKQTLDLLRYASQDAISTSIELPEALNAGLLTLVKTEIDSETISGGGGGSAPSEQVLFGTGSGTSSSNKFTYDGVNLKVDSGTDGISGLTLPKLKLQSALTVSNFAATGPSPYSVNIDNLGNIYTTNSDSTITKITPEGSSSEFCFFPGVNSDNSVLFDSEQNIYVAAENSVKKLLPDGTLSYSVDFGAGTIVKFAVSANSDIYVVTNDGTGNVYKSENGASPTIFSTMTGVVGQNYKDIVLTNQGIIYIVGQRQISKIQSNGISAVLTVFQNGFSGGNTVIDSFGNLYCSRSIAGGNILKITQQGVVTVFATLGTYSNGIVIDSLNNIYAVEVLGGDVFKITSDGTKSLLLNAGTYSVDLFRVSEDLFYFTSLLTGQIRKTSISTIPSILSVDGQGGLVTVNLDLSYTGYLANGILNTNLAGTSTIIPAVDSTKSGLMIPADKAKLDSYSTTNGNVNTYLSGTGSFTVLPSMTASTIIGTGAQGTSPDDVSIGVNSNSTGNGVAIGGSSYGISFGVSVGQGSSGNHHGVGIGASARGENYGVAIGYICGAGISNRIEIAPRNSSDAIRARISGQSTNKSIQMTCPQSDTAPTNAAFDFTNADGTLPQSMYQVQVNAAGTSAKIYFNIGGVIKSATLPLT